MKLRPSRTRALALAAMAAGMVALVPAVWSQASENSAEQDASESGMIPVAPQDLFAAMPGKMRLWELVKSTAERRYGSWLESRAVREFKRQLPPTEGEEPGPPAHTRITVTDTGKHTSALEPFADFTPGEEDGYERKFIDGHPAFVIDYGKGEQEIELLVAERFVVRLIFENQPEKYIEEWLRRLKLRELAGISDSEVVELPEEILITRLDQLDPKRNQAYQLATSSKARVDQELAEDEAWVNEMIGEIPDLPDEPEEAEAESGDEA